MKAKSREKTRNPCEMQGSSWPQSAVVLVELAPWSQPNTGRKRLIRQSICHYFRRTYSQTYSHFVPLSLSPLGMQM